MANYRELDSNADQWLLDGDCDKCRRKNYCKTTCKNHERKLMRDMTRTAMTTALKIMDSIQNPKNQ